MIESQSSRITFPKTTRRYSQDDSVRHVAKLKFENLSEAKVFLTRNQLNNPVISRSIKDNTTGGGKTKYIIEIDKNQLPGNTEIDFIQRRSKGVDAGYPMTLDMNTHMLDIEMGRNGATGDRYFAYPTSEFQSMPEYLDTVAGVQNCQRAMEVHTLSHIDNRSSYGHGLIVQAPLDLTLLTAQNNIQNISRAIQIVAGRISTIARKDILKMEQIQDIPEGNYHDGFKLNFSANYMLILAELKEIDRRSHAYMRVQEAVKDTLKRAKLRSQYGENLEMVVDTATTVVSKWDTDLLGNYGEFDRQILEKQLPAMLANFNQSIEKMRSDFGTIQGRD